MCAVCRVCIVRGVDEIWMHCSIVFARFPAPTACYVVCVHSLARSFSTFYTATMEWWRTAMIKGTKIKFWDERWDGCYLISIFNKKHLFIHLKPHVPLLCIQCIWTRKNFAANYQLHRNQYCDGNIFIYVKIYSKM